MNKFHLDLCVSLCHKYFPNFIYFNYIPEEYTDYISAEG